MNKEERQINFVLDISSHKVLGGEEGWPTLTISSFLLNNSEIFASYVFSLFINLCTKQRIVFGTKRVYHLMTNNELKKRHFG